MQILQAHAQKVAVASSVDFDHLAASTEGFSGADLQALIYNAHLEVVHSEMHVTSSLSDTKEDADEKPIEFVAFGKKEEKAGTSLAEQMAVQRRVSASPGPV